MSDQSGDDPSPGSSDGGPSGRVRAALARIVDASVRERLALSVAALATSLLIGGVLVLLSGLVATCQRPFLVTPVGALCYDPIAVYYQLFVAPFLSCQGLLRCTISWFFFALTLKETVLLLFTGLSVAIAFRAGLFNIGTQGQLVLGALATALGVLWLAPHAPGGLAGTLVLVPAGVAIGALVGGLYGAIPGALKAYSGANEVITTIMLNFVATNVAFYLVATFFKDPGSQSIETRPLPANAQLTPVLPGPGGSELFAGSSFSVVALVGGLVMVAGIYYLFFHTSFGYDLRTSGLQPAAALFGGVEAERMVVTSMFLSGALGGVGGAVYVMMVLGRWRTGIPAIGFDGITVSILASNHPLAVVLAAGLFGVLKSGSLAINTNLGVPTQLVGVLRGLVILFVAMPEFFRILGRTMGLGGSTARPPAAPEGEGDTGDPESAGADRATGDEGTGAGEAPTSGTGGESSTPPPGDSNPDDSEVGGEASDDATRSSSPAGGPGGSSWGDDRASGEGDPLDEWISPGSDDEGEGSGGDGADEADADADDAAGDENDPAGDGDDPADDGDDPADDENGGEGS